MKTTTNNNQQPNNVQVTNNANAAATYLQRMQANKATMQSISKLWRELHTDTLLNAAIPAKDNAGAFKEFCAYMKKRYNIEDAGTPARGWSVWYALQWCEQQAKQAAKEGNNAAKSWRNISAKALEEKRAKMLAK